MVDFDASASSRCRLSQLQQIGWTLRDDAERAMAIRNSMVASVMDAGIDHGPEDAGLTSAVCRGRADQQPYNQIK
jgi:hypothetical protein